MAPKGFEPGSCGARGKARFHWANKGSESLLCHQLYLIRQRAVFHPRCIKRFPPDRPQNRHSPRRLRFLHRVRHHHHLGPFVPPQSPVGGDDEGDQESRAISSREQPKAGPSDQEVHPGSRRCGAAPALRRLCRRGGKHPRRPARVREGHPQSHSHWRLDIDACKT
jgi:hypothetical protein